MKATYNLILSNIALATALLITLLIWAYLVGISL
jgi:hypothetical protein